MSETEEAKLVEDTRIKEFIGWVDHLYEIRNRVAQDDLGIDEAFDQAVKMTREML